MRYQVIIETAADETHKTEWIIGGQFYQKELAELFARSYERENRIDGYEAIVVDLEKKETFLLCGYGYYRRGD